MIGLPEFDFPPLDPFLYEHGEGAFNNGDLRGEITVTNLTVKGLKKNHITDVRAHLADDVFRLEVDYVLPRLYLRSSITTDAKLGPFSMKGKGTINSTQNVYA